MVLCKRLIAVILTVSLSVTPGFAADSEAEEDQRARWKSVALIVATVVVAVTAVVIGKRKAAKNKALEEALEKAAREKEALGKAGKTVGKGEGVVQSLDREKILNLYSKDYGIIEYEDRYTYERSIARLGLRPPHNLGLPKFSSRLNVFWAQEATGTPEARMLMEKIGKKLDLVDSNIAIIDGGFTPPSVMSETMRSRMHDDLSVDSNWSDIMDNYFRNNGNDNHAAKVLGIILGEAPVGVSSRGKVTHVRADNRGSDIFSLREETTFSENSLAVEPDLVNVSLGGLGVGLEDIAKAKEEVGLRKTIFIKGVGNDFPLSGDDKIIANLGDEIITVGSADPGGFPSEFSQVSEKVIVLAPADTFQVSEIGGTLTRFGGTSGATPMVTGALADTMSILPDLSRDEAVIMLQKTATRTSIHSTSQVDGAGVLNHYKMLRVAARLRDAGFHELDSTQRTALLSSSEKLYDGESLFDFSKEATKLRREAQKLLASNETEAFKKLRLAFFLDSTDEKTRKTLAAIYRDAGHQASAEFYDVTVDLNEPIAKNAPYHIEHIHNKYIARKTISG